MKTRYAILLLLVGAAAHAAEVRDLRVSENDGYTRAVLDLSGKLDYRVFSLANPHRAVVDISNARVGAGVTSEAISAGVLEGVRAGKRGQRDARLVLDLGGPVQIKSFLLPPSGAYGHRLVVDLYPGVGISVGEPRVAMSARAVATQRDVIVAIDAGHGGKDPGAIGPSGTHEKDVVLEIAKDLARRVDREPGMKSVLIRDGDQFVSLRDRYGKARAKRADLFISIHADAFYDYRVRGSSVYVLSQRGASSEAARWLARRHNAVDNLGGVALKDKDEALTRVLLDLSQSATREASFDVASRIFQELKRLGKTHKKKVESGSFIVLKAPDVPSVLVETAYISNPDEEKRLRDPAHRGRVAQAILQGVVAHFRDRPPPGTWLAANRTTGEHVVTRGETLSEIAARHRVSLTSLRAANNLGNDMLRVGDRLRIPAS